MVVSLTMAKFKGNVKVVIRGQNHIKPSHQITIWPWVFNVLHLRPKQRIPFVFKTTYFGSKLLFCAIKPKVELISIYFTVISVVS